VQGRDDIALVTDSAPLAAFSTDQDSSILLPGSQEGPVNQSRRQEDNLARVSPAMGLMAHPSIDAIRGESY